MRAVLLGAVLAGTLGLTAGVARADIYLYRDAQGALHFTNAPAARGGQLVVKETIRRAPAPRVLAVGAGGVRKAGLKGSSLTPYDSLIREIADRHEVEYALVKAVIKAESGFDRLAVSRAGAQGLMQLMPGTAAQHQVRDAFGARDNIEGGVRHLRMLLDRYGGNLPLTLAAYNAGQTTVENAGGVPAIRETREYLARVLRYRLNYLRESAGVLEARR
jgi:soluble lytic murein transglycosylase-like protein